MSIQEFLKYKYACQAAREWADGKSFQEIWQTCPKTGWLIWLLKKLGFETRNFQELAISSAEGVTHLMQDERSKHAVKELRRWLNGESVNLMEVRLTAIANASYAADNGDYDLAASSAEYVAVYAANAQNAAANGAADESYISVRAADIIRNHITFEQVAQAAQNQGIEI